MKPTSGNPDNGPDSEPPLEPNRDLIEERRQYQAGSLERDALAADPNAQFEKWLGDARNYKLIDATSMVLATVDSRHQPHSRIVLLKQFDSSGFVWFTDRSSAKGQQIGQNNQACILFFWRELERQVRIEGEVSMLNAADSDKYFYSRPDGSRFSAAASQQSSVVDNREVLENQVAELRLQHPEGDVPRPERWGGYCLKPSYFEFWQGRNDRLHDRFTYSKSAGNSPDWSIDRLSP